MKSNHVTTSTRRHDHSGVVNVAIVNDKDEQQSPSAALGLSIDTPTNTINGEDEILQQQQDNAALHSMASVEERLAARTVVLEDRVRDLETKLAVLSKLLKVQANKNGSNNSNGNNHPLLSVFSSPAGPESFKGGGTSTRQTSWKQEDSPPLLLPEQQQQTQAQQHHCPSTPPPSTSTTANQQQQQRHQELSVVPPTTPPQTPTDPQQQQRERSHSSIPVLESPAACIGKDAESATLSWRKERQRQPPHFALYDEPPQPQPPVTTLPIFEGVPTTTTTTTTTFQPSSNVKVNYHHNNHHNQNQQKTSNEASSSLSFDGAFRLPESAIPKGEALAPHKRNLSLHILYQGDEKAYTRGKLTNSVPPAQTSMTLADRRWLGSLAQTIDGERQQLPDDNVRDKWLNYLNSFQESTMDVDLQMEEFIKVPGQVENIMLFGFYICVDSFLYCVTVLPIRFVWSVLLLVLRFLFKQSNPAFTFHRRHSYQIIQVFILYCVCAYVLAPISIGQLYHWIRGQAMIKLYVLIAIVEVFDRLMCSMGQDCLDSMYWNTVNRPTSTRMLISVAVVLVYCTIHTLLLFVHVATLNVAMNSADQALLALLISGNFAEIKSTVFKKYNRPALFKLTASDICERFKLGLFLGLVLLLNYCQGMERGQFVHFLCICGLIWGGELLADWIKHSFITKFNFLPARVFVEYSLLLAGDVTGIGHEGVNVDHSHAVVKRIGFAQLPFVCVSFRLVMEAAKYAAMNEFWQSLSRAHVWGLMAAFWFVLLIVKIALGSSLYQLSLSKLRAAPEMKFSPKKKKKE